MTGVTPGTPVRLGEIGRSLIGLTYNPTSVRRNGVLVLRSSNIQDGRLTFDDNVYVDCAIPDKIRIRANDILICVRNGSRRLIGKSVMLDERVVGQTFGAFMAVYRSDANEFLQYFLQSDDFKRQIDEHLGATINQITNASLNGFIVVLPSHLERRVIVACLQDVDMQLDAFERLIAKRGAILIGMVQTLLVGSVRLPEFGVPWSDLRVADLVEQHRKAIDPGRYPTVVFQHYSLPSFDANQLPAWGVGSSIDSAKFAVPPSAVLVSKLNPRIPRIWAPSEIAGNAIASTEFLVLTPRPGIQRSFLKWLMRSDAIAGPMKRLATGTTGSHARVHSRQVLGLEVAVPRADEQAAIAEVLDEAEAELRVLNERLAKARCVKQGMMQQLLTGRTRLPVEEAVA